MATKTFILIEIVITIGLLTLRNSSFAKISITITGG